MSHLHFLSCNELGNVFPVFITLNLADFFNPATLRSFRNLDDHVDRFADYRLNFSRSKRVT